MFITLDGLEGVDDNPVANLELGIVVEHGADSLASFHGGVDAFKGFGEAGFECSLTPRRFRDESGELFVAGSFEPGTIVALWYTQCSFPAGKCAPYQIRLNDGRMIYAPMDKDHVIRADPAE